MANYLILTGGSQGIGEKTISLFMQQGWQAINLSRRNCKIENVLNINVDLSQKDALDGHQEQLKKLLQGADKICIVHNAAAFESDSIHTLTSDDFRNVLEINLVAPVRLNQIVMPYMKEGSAIIYIGSTLSEQAVSNRASYVTTKHATIGLMRSTSQDLVGRGIHTVCICPGFVNTEMLMGNVKDTASFMRFIESKVTAKRLIQPEEIADVIYFCALHPIVNGSVLHANLGQVTT